MNQVHIEFQRVQTWLFAVPRLRAMVGANTLLGETLRIALPDLARSTGRWTLAPLSGTYPGADPDDPLKDHDDPAADARDGIRARDGGHFEACFANGAEAFADEAAALLRRELPGLRFRVSIDGTERKKSGSHVSTELPVLAPCEWTGRGLASANVEQGAERASVSLDVSRRHETAKRAESGQAADLASMLIAETSLRQLPAAKTFQELVGTGYLALIHADGNDVGSGASGDAAKDAEFFQRNRVLVRCALKGAIEASCASVSASAAPVLPLMLGGDDVLIVSRADVALPFVVDLCARLEALQREKATDFELTLGVGVVIAKHTIPIHRLHDVAEQLASSAKRRFRGLAPGARKSVVDWTVCSTAWVDDPEEVRRRDWIRGAPPGTRVLSQRPLPVLGAGLDTLKGLVEAARGLNAAPRSQLRYLVEQLGRGHELSELAFAELSSEARGALEYAGVKRVWQRVGDEGPWLTPLLDLVEISEIGRLGRTDQNRLQGDQHAGV